MAKGIMYFTTACFLIVVGCTTPGRRAQSHVSPTAAPGASQDGQAPSAYPILLAAYMPWFGDHAHIDVGYSSQDPAVLHHQIEQAKQRGISAFVVDWNGERQPFSDHNFGLIEQAASEQHFHVALLYNEAEGDDSQATDDALAAFQKAYDSYIGPQAPNHNAYLTYQDRPMIFIFPKRAHTDWDRIRDYCNRWQSPPLLIYKDQPPDQFANAFAGAYAWVQPGREGWKPDGSNWGQDYLDYFYKNMRSKFPDKIAVGGAWPGFDDSRARWGLNRHMQTRCGQTLDDTLAFYHRYYDDSKPLPFLLIETWNDYEEGTAIERPPVNDCRSYTEAHDPQNSPTQPASPAAPPTE